MCLHASGCQVFIDKLTGIHDNYALVPRNSPERFITADNVFRVTCQCAGEKFVVVGIGANLHG
jgi:hypothetical protein